MSCLLAFLVNLLSKPTYLFTAFLSRGLTISKYALYFLFSYYTGLVCMFLLELTVSQEDISGRENFQLYMEDLSSDFFSFLVSCPKSRRKSRPKQLKAASTFS